ncbi:MAG: DNA-directed RNA polymerase subunit omega [Alphaproteobacteria bacterium]|nr:DNA-directed RNA polymerase subunit omega [Alphaproteobacteria bacterium]
MARITVEDCLEKVPNRFSLVLVAAERTKQLIKGEKALLDESVISKNKEVVTALREIAAGAVLPDLSEFDENMLLHGPAGRTAAAATLGALPPEVDDDLPPEMD